MAPSDNAGGGGGGAEKRTDGKIRRLTPRWLEATLASNRVEFEREMQRNREGFASELERYWRSHRPAS